jgi:hypothetical protein
MKIGSFQISAEVNRSLEEKTLSGLNPEERGKCSKFWMKFRILERLQWIALAIPLLLFWVFPGLEARTPRTLFLFLFGVFGVYHVWLYTLNCPVCGAKFSGGLVALLPRVNYPWKCDGCYLSRRS